MAAKFCPVCNGPVSQLGDFVRVAGREHHVSCFIEPIKNEFWGKGYAQHRKDLDEANARTAAESELKVRAEREAKAIQDEALRVLNVEKARKLEATKKATEALRSQDQGESTPRFALVAEDIDYEFHDAEVKRKAEEQARQAAEQARQAAEQARQAAAIKDKCVRCGSPETSEYHPRHCSKCWNDDQTGQDAGLSKQDLSKLEIPQYKRPIELE